MDYSIGDKRKAAKETMHYQVWYKMSGYWYPANKVCSSLGEAEQDALSFLVPAPDRIRATATHIQTFMKVPGVYKTLERPSHLVNDPPSEVSLFDEMDDGGNFDDPDEDLAEHDDDGDDW